ncbi:MAG: PBP1A family penicillin-binding protein [Deltaproteobacteria bacterium]|nr:PBP1A family penicillin-binding protein [Deltaproteobacteria bacterium]
MSDAGGTKTFWQRLKRWAVRFVVAVVGMALLGALAVGGVLWYFSMGLPEFDSLADYHPPQVTRMVDRHGRQVAELFDEKRTVVPIERIPEHVRLAFLAAEDADFYEHPGMDFTGLLRAFWVNLKSGKVVQGGSTITQQVIKTFILGPEKSYARKIRELLLAMRLEKNLSKDEILSLYLNQIYFGHSCYGIQEASRFYFGKDVEQISLSEGAALAALPKSPARYSLVRHRDRAQQRRNWVLGQMATHKMAAASDVERAERAPLEVVGESPDFFELAPYYAEHCRRALEDRLGREKLYQGGLRIELSVDLDLQRAAQRAVEEGLRAVDRRQGYRGALGKLDAQSLKALCEEAGLPLPAGQIWTLVKTESKAGEVAWRASKVDRAAVSRVLAPVVAIEGEGKAARAVVELGSNRAQLDLEAVEWARAFSPVRQTPKPRSVTEVLSVGDVVEIELGAGGEIGLSQPPLVQGALIGLDAQTRNVVAMVGGSDFRASPLVRAVQSKRQPGSAFKPILYTAAVRYGGYTPTSIVMDTPEVYRSSLRGKAWKPRNFERVFLGPVSIRYALAHSVNTVAVKLASDIGPKRIIETARALGIESELTSNLSLALGSSEVTPLELTNAYATLAAGGTFRAPVFISRVLEADGTPVALDPQEERQAVDPEDAYIVTSLMRSVIEEGTGRGALRLDRPLAGKTGTANQQRDGWFVGFSPQMICGVWVGFDDHARMGTGWAQGAGTALPIWMRYMETALADKPRQDFSVPAGIVFARVDPENGLLAPPRMAGARVEVFKTGTEPRGISNRQVDSGENLTSPAPQVGRLPEGLFQ